MNALIRHLLALWLALFAALASTPAQSAPSNMTDIDIYGLGSSADMRPNILFVLDNTANWSKIYDDQKKALTATFNSLAVNKYRIGLMLYTESGNGNTGQDGGYVRSAIRTLDTTYRDKFNALLDSFVVNRDQSNGGKAGLTMAEAYYYFAGKPPLSGNGKVKADYAGNTSGTSQDRDIYNLGSNALTGFNGNYNSPVQSNCAGNYIVFISNGPPSDNSSDSSLADDKLAAAYSALSITKPPNITGLVPNKSEGNMADEWARFMKVSPQAITTFTLDVNPDTTGQQGPGWTALLKSMAVRSGGEYYAVSSTGTSLQVALGDIFNQINAVNSVFASASLPVSVNARGTYLNQVFMGMFRPDGSGKPRWRGNLKQYKFGYDPTTDTLRLEDSQGNSAVTGTTGFISPSATSFWTSASSFWTGQELGSPKSASDAPDGEVVEKGGAAQKLRTVYGTDQSTRKVLTCVACTGSLSSFDTSNSKLTTSLFGPTVDSTERADIINWARGSNNRPDDGNDIPSPGVTVRPSVHGDVLHSRPAVINYDSTTGIVVYYGANDGLLHAVNGNQSGTNAGKELWSFLPPESLPKLKRLRDNSPEIRLSTTDMTAATGTPPTPREYAVDGPIGVYQKISNGATSRAIIYVALRRGGRAFYALDVTDPYNPLLLWKKTSADVPILGQTWSEPRVARLKNRTDPVVIMGAGYDATAQDATTPGMTTMGNAILVFDAFTGTLLNSSRLSDFTTDRSVAADISLVDADYDGRIDRAYAADTGGNVYRIDFEDASGSSAPSAWRMYKLASLSAGGVTRKVFYPPDVVLLNDKAAVLVGTGDREKPLIKTNSDAFFTIYDPVPLHGSPAADFPTTGFTPGQLGIVGTDRPSTAAGCYMPLGGTGEKVINAPVTVAGNTYFSTNTPGDANTCTGSLGTAKVYAAPLFCQAAVSETRAGGGMPPTAVSGIVTVSYTDPSTGKQLDKQVPFLIGGTASSQDPGDCSKKSGIEGCKVRLSVPATRSRKYWYMERAH